MLLSVLVTNVLPEMATGLGGVYYSLNACRLSPKIVELKRTRNQTPQIFTPLHHTYHWAYCNTTYWSQGTHEVKCGLPGDSTELAGYSTSTVSLAFQGSKAKEWWLSGHTLQRWFPSLHQGFCARNLRIHPRGWNERLPRAGELRKSFKNHLKEITPLWSCSLQTDTKKKSPPTKKNMWIPLV